MNKFIFVAFALFAVVSFVQCTDNDDYLEKVKSKHIRKYLRNRKDTLDSGLSKLEEHCPGVSEKLKDALVAFGECDDRVDDSLTICDAIQSATLNCTQPLIKVVDDCLPEKAKGLPLLGIKSVLSVSDFLCKQNGEAIFELLNPCLWEDLEESNEQINECEEKVTSKLKQHKDSIPSPSEVCSVVTSMRTCVRTRTEKTCKNAKTRNVAIGLYDAVVAPCSSINQV
ncbi:DUF1397 domain containing protein [Asbolus verrucosus]|uniref:DUF1397 domain containing protein n=1 Tax=Asbolus verrucosus TaxID=1661398 RepID=A0A482VUT6_ASBVE|nr:DUF1397 domain containing protein [Asbolus verrucosus]